MLENLYKLSLCNGYGAFADGRWSRHPTWVSIGGRSPNSSHFCLLVFSVLASHLYSSFNARFVLSKFMTIVSNFILLDRWILFNALFKRFGKSNLFMIELKVFSIFRIWVKFEVSCFISISFCGWWEVTAVFLLEENY